jgi:hypothetical protein
MLTLANIYGKVKFCGKITLNPIKDIIINWILITGFWNDNNVWDDIQNWID